MYYFQAYMTPYISQNLGQISLKKCNGAVLTSLKRMCDLGAQFPHCVIKGPQILHCTIKGPHSIITSSKNLQFPIASRAQVLIACQGARFLHRVIKGPQFLHCVIKRTPISPLRHIGHAPQLNNM